jgi:hypothetical protein
MNVDWIHVVQGRNQWWRVANMVTKFPGPIISVEFLY